MRKNGGEQRRGGQGEEWGDEEEEETRGKEVESLKPSSYESTCFEGKERRKGTTRRRETRRKRDKGMKERSLISRDSDQTEEAKQTENRGLLRVMFRLTAARSPCFQRLFCFPSSTCTRSCFPLRTSAVL